MAKVKIETLEFLCPNSLTKLKQVRDAIGANDCTGGESRKGGSILFTVSGPKTGIKNLGKDLKRFGGMKKP